MVSTHIETALVDILLKVKTARPNGPVVLCCLQSQSCLSLTQPMPDACPSPHQEGLCTHPVFSASFLGTYCEISLHLQITCLRLVEEARRAALASGPNT